MGPAVEAAVEVLRQLGRSADTWRIDNVAEEQLPGSPHSPHRGERTDEFVYDPAKLAALRAAVSRNEGGRQLLAKHHADVQFEPFSDRDVRRHWRSTAVVGGAA